MEPLNFTLLIYSEKMTVVDVFNSVGCGVVIGGSSKFDREAKNIVKIVIETANGASDTIQDTTSAMKDMIANLEASTSDSGSEQTSGPLISTSHQLDAKAATIQWQANKNRLLIHKGLNIMYVTLLRFVDLLGTCQSKPTASRYCPF